MSELSTAERLIALRFHRRALVRYLAQTDEWIATMERKAAEEQTGRERALPPPAWLLTSPAGDSAPTLHTTLGDHADACWIVEPRDVRTRRINREKAAQAMTEGATACTLCRPDTVLGFLG